MDDELRNLLNRLDKPTRVNECVACGKILFTDDIPDSCPRCKRIVKKDNSNDTNDNNTDDEDGDDEDDEDEDDEDEDDEDKDARRG